MVERGWSTEVVPEDGARLSLRDVCQDLSRLRVPGFVAGRQEIGQAHWKGKVGLCRRKLETISLLCGNLQVL